MYPAVQVLRRYNVSTILRVMGFSHEVPAVMLSVLQESTLNLQISSEFFAPATLPGYPAALRCQPPGTA